MSLAYAEDSLDTLSKYIKLAGTGKSTTSWQWQLTASPSTFTLASDVQPADEEAWQWKAQTYHMLFSLKANGFKNTLKYNSIDQYVNKPWNKYC